MRNTIRTLLEDAVRYQTQGRHEAAEVTTREALKLFKQHFLTENDCKAQDFYQLAYPLLEAGRFDQALPLVREAYQLNPDHRHAFLGYLRATFCLDRYEEFWKLHEDRRRFLDNLIAYERIYGKEKMWNGIDSLKGKRVLVYGEGGAGDQIQFVRYLPWLKVRGCTIVFNCTAALAPLMQLHCIDEIVYKEHVSMDHKPDCDYHLPLMSLPYHLKMWEPFWLDMGIRSKKRIELPAGKLKVGFVFTPNPKTFEAPENVINVGWLEKCKVPGVQFYNLHYEQPAHLESVIDLCDQINDFSDLANYIDAMDVVLSIDSAVLHLAGSMQKKTLGLIRKNSNWRWGTGDRTIWYPTARLIRQTIAGDWSDVFNKVGLYLAKSSFTSEHRDSP